jgi:hypothetical protein
MIVGNRTDGNLYRIDLDGTGGRTIAPITGLTVPVNGGMALDGNRPVVADAAGLASSRSATTPAAPHSSSRSATRHSTAPPP